jgi:hypothetical protein
MATQSYPRWGGRRNELWTAPEHSDAARSMWSTRPWICGARGFRRDYSWGLQRCRCRRPLNSNSLVGLPGLDPGPLDPLCGWCRGGWWRTGCSRHLLPTAHCPLPRRGALWRSVIWSRVAELVGESSCVAAPQGRGDPARSSRPTLQSLTPPRGRRRSTRTAPGSACSTPER